MNGYPPAKPSVNSYTDQSEYLDLCVLDPDKRIQIIERMEKGNPELLSLLTNDPFIEGLQKTFGATIQIEKRKKHMIIIRNPEVTTNTQIMLIKKWFEVDQVIEDWDGKERVDEKQKTVLITKTPPPYKVPYTQQVLSMEQTKVLLNS